MKILAEQTSRIGHQALIQQWDRHFVILINRTYETIIEVPEDKVEIWKELLNKKQH